MRLQRTIFILLMAIFFTSSAHASLGVKFGLFNTKSATHYGGGLTYGIGLPVTGLGVEAEASGYYADSSFVNFFFLQTTAGLNYDFNALITPDSDLLHPYLRAGLGYGFIFSSDTSTSSNDHAPGFYTGAGLNLHFPVVLVGIEANYTYFNFGSLYDGAIRSLFLRVGLRF